MPHPIKTNSNYIKVCNVTPTLKAKAMNLVMEDYTNLSDWIKGLMKTDLKKREEEESKSSRSAYGHV